MERFHFEIPGPERKDDAIDFINEFYRYSVKINGTGGLNRYVDDYEGWLEKLELDYFREADEEKVPARTYFLIRESDERIVGMINIRLELNEKLRRYGGNIGYCIRPTEQGKGCNKVNLYLGLKVCDSYGIETVYLDADIDNPASWKTMEALGGKRIREYYDGELAHCTVVDYRIDVKKALSEHPEYDGRLLEITVKMAETEDELRGKAYVHWKSWQEAYPGLVRQEYLDKLTLEKCERIAFEWPDGMFVAKDGGRVVGFAGYGHRDGDAPQIGEVFALYVLKEYYGTGVGCLLMNAALEQLKGYEEICLWTLKENRRAIRFYEKCGFYSDGEEKKNAFLDAEEIRMTLGTR